MYVVIMTFGYRSDDMALRALLGKQFKYIGMLGSKKKIEKVIFSSVTKEGKQVHLPSLAKLEYTRYVRSPFNSHVFAIVHHLTERFGLSPQNELLDFGTNMPVKTYMYDITSETAAGFSGPGKLVSYPHIGKYPNTNEKGGFILNSGK